MQVMMMQLRRTCVDAGRVCHQAAAPEARITLLCPSAGPWATAGKERSNAAGCLTFIPQQSTISAISSGACHCQ